MALRHLTRIANPHCIKLSCSNGLISSRMENRSKERSIKMELQKRNFSMFAIVFYSMVGFGATGVIMGPIFAYAETNNDLQKMGIRPTIGNALPLTILRAPVCSFALGSIGLTWPISVPLIYFLNMKEIDLFILKHLKKREQNNKEPFSYQNDNNNKTWGIKHKE